MTAQTQQLEQLRREVAERQSRVMNSLAGDPRRVAPCHWWRSMADWLHWSGLPHAQHPDADEQSLTATLGLLELWLSVSDLAADAALLWCDPESDVEDEN